MFSTRKHYPDSVPTSVAQLALTPECCFLSGEATHTNFKVFGLTRPCSNPRCTALKATTVNFHYWWSKQKYS